MTRYKTRWHRHPGVRTGGELTAGERAADRMRNGMGSWAFVIGALVFLALWMAANVAAVHFDRYPFILLNLVLSCVAALQGAILLIAAKRSDAVASELAVHDLEQDTQSRQMLDALTLEFAAQNKMLRQLLDLAASSGSADGDVAAVTLENDSHRALAILLQRAGGSTEVTEAEVINLDRRGMVTATQNRIEGTITLEYRGRS